MKDDDINTITSVISKKSNKYVSLQQSLKRFVNMHQKPNEPIEDYFTRFEGAVQQLIFICGKNSLACDKFIVDDSKDASDKRWQ
mmetsp:Transcript_4242/g.4813  ORF Transcript_4242/g.4813 Transcript_4242/m.4813 type:complete len:84 (-) Transcript_4242:725-976(-)